MIMMTHYLLLVLLLYIMFLLTQNLLGSWVQILRVKIVRDTQV